MISFSSCETAPKEVTTDLINFTETGSDVADKELPVIKFDETERDFGKIIDGKKVAHSFEFTNTGTSPLIINRIEPSCGCTVVKDWPKDPIAPGDGGSITVEFDSKDRPGKQTKMIAVMANTSPAKSTLFLMGEVIGPDQK